MCLRVCVKKMYADLLCARSTFTMSVIAVVVVVVYVLCGSECVCV